MEDISCFEDDFLIEDGVLKSYTGRDECILVPDVHTIGEGAFKGCVSLKKVVLPDGLCRILSGAFKGCRKLREIEIPSGVSWIGDYAFHRCHSLESVSLPASVRELGDCVFLYCDSLTYVSMPGVRRLRKQVFVNDVRLKRLELCPELDEACICDVFTGCGNITDFSFPDGSGIAIPNAVEAVAGGMALPSLVRSIAVDILRMMELDGRCLVKFLTNLKHVEIPEGIEKIGKSCFFDKRGIISVAFPASLREIDSRALRNCISLECVSFQNDQVVIHEDAFMNCSSLKEIVVPDKTSYGIKGISGLSGDDIPSLVTAIRRQVLGNFRLSGSVLLKYLGSESRVVVPEGVTSVGEEAFSGNEAIDRVILPDSVESIGAGAFRDCLVLQTVELPENLRHIGAGAFENCVKLIRVLLPGGVDVIEDKVFKHCHGLREIGLGTNVRAIGEQAFYGCRALTAIAFPDSLTFLGKMAFYRCGALREVFLPPGLNRVESLAFAGSGVKKAQVGGSGIFYGSDIFSGCGRLGAVVFKRGVCHIPDKMAYGCTRLKQVVLPDSLESVGRHALEHTPFLEAWRRDGKDLIKGGGVFWDGRDLVKDDVFWDGRDLVKGGVFWDGRDAAGEFHVPDGTKIVAGGAFYGNTALTAVWFPDSVAWIGPGALKGCESLRQVVWPGGITVAEAEVFSGCVRLAEVSCRQIGLEGDFRSVSIPIPWQIIKERAFYNCRSLCHISLEHVRTVGKEAFKGCASFLPGKADVLSQAGESAFEHTLIDSQISSFSVVGSILVDGRRCEGLVKVPEGIRAIAPFAFAGNQQVTGLCLPESLRNIGDGAFWGCKELTCIHFPSFLDVVGRRAFEKCAGLVRVSLRAGRMGEAAFAWCLSLERAEIDCAKVLEDRLFDGCRSLRQCVCGQVSVVGRYCFSGCGKLDGFDFGTVGEIGEYAFQNCDSLRQAAFMDGAVIRPHAFEDCGDLEWIALEGEKGQVSLCEYAFSGCTGIRQVTWRGQAWTFHEYRDILRETTPEIVRLIFHSCFSCFEIEKEEILCRYRGLGHRVRIPYGIKRIEAEVFRDVLMLEEVAIPDSVEYIGARAFHGTLWLERQRELSPLVIVNRMLLDGSCCQGYVIVPRDVRLVCGWAFAGGMGIEEIRFLSDRVKVEPYAFRNCIYLKELVLGDNFSVVFQGIGDRKRDLPPLAMQAAGEMLNCFKTDGNDMLVECTGNISRLLVADGIRAVGDGVFQDGNLLTEITLPLSVTSIGNRAFAGCKWLKYVKQAYGVVSIGNRAFAGCGALERVELSESLGHMGARAFENCTLLEEILLPEGLEEIPDRAFFRCQSLKKVSFPSTLKRIGREAFAYCKSLMMPVVPDGVFVDERAFAGVFEFSEVKVCDIASWEIRD